VGRLGALTFRLSRQRSTINARHGTFEALTLSRFAGGRCASRGSIGHRKDGKMPAVHAHVFGVHSAPVRGNSAFYLPPFFSASVRAGARSGYPS